MDDFLVRGLVMAILLMVVFCIAGVYWLLYTRPWWPSLLYQAVQHPGSYIPWLSATLIASDVLGYSVCGAAGLWCANLLWVLVAPSIIVPRIAQKVWKDDTPETRDAALAVRNRIRASAGQAPLDGSQCWNQYVLDTARAERQAQYRAPGD